MNNPTIIKNDEIVKVSYSHSSATNLPSSANFPHQFYSLLEKIIRLQNINNPFTIHSLRIFLILLSIVKKDQLRNQNQLDLFDNDWYSTEKSTKDQVQFFLKLRDLVPKGSTNYHHAKKGLSFFVNFVTKQTFTVKDKKISLESSIINNLVYNEKEIGVKFYMHAYWYKEFLDLTRYYNQISTKTIFTISTLQSYLFYMFLTRIEKSKTDPGSTSLLLETLNEKFLTNYKYWSKVEEKFLKPIKTMLDKNAERSFNYVIEGNKVNIVAYYTSDAAPSIISQVDYRIAKAVRYKKNKHKLSENQTSFLQSFYIKYSYDTVAAAIGRKKELQLLTGQVYLERLHSYLQIYLDNKEKILKKVIQ